MLPKGTAFITDAGMTGPHDSVIGVEAELAIRRMRTGLPVRFETAQGGVRIEGALIECDSETGKASAIEAVRVHVSPDRPAHGSGSSSQSKHERERPTGGRGRTSGSA